MITIITCLLLISGTVFFTLCIVNKFYEIIYGPSILILFGILFLINIEVDLYKFENQCKINKPDFYLQSAKLDTLDIYNIQLKDKNNKTFSLHLPLKDISALGISADSVLMYNEL